MFYDCSVNVREAVSPPLMTIGKLLMIDSEQVEKCRLKVVNVNTVLHNTVTKIVGPPMSCAAFDTATRHPHRIAPRMMIPTKIVTVQFTLTVIGSPKLARPYHKGVV